MHLLTLSRLQFVPEEQRRPIVSIVNTATLMLAVASEGLEAARCDTPALEIPGQLAGRVQRARDE